MVNFVNVECEREECLHDIFTTCGCDVSVVLVAVPADIVSKLPGVVFWNYGSEQKPDYSYSSCLPASLMLQVPNSFVVRR